MRKKASIFYGALAACFGEIQVIFSFRPNKADILRHRRNSKEQHSRHTLGDSPSELTPDAEAPQIIPRPTSLPPSGKEAVAPAPDTPVVQSEALPPAEEPVIDADDGTPTKVDGVQQYIMKEQPGAEGINPEWKAEPKPTAKPRMLNMPRVELNVPAPEDYDNHPNDSIEEKTFPPAAYVAATPNRIMYQIAFGLLFVVLAYMLYIGSSYIHDPASMLVKPKQRSAAYVGQLHR